MAGGWSDGNVVAPLATVQAHSPSPTPPHVPDLWRYVLAIVILMAGVYVQYLPFYPHIQGLWQGELFGAATTYLPGLVAFFALLGPQTLRNFVHRTQRGTVEGLRWFGVFGVLTILLVILLAAVYLAIDAHHYIQFLDRYTQLEQTAASAPLFFIAISFPVGIIEETLFRGFVLGGALLLFGTRRWKVHAVWTSLLFTAAHAYYAQTYQEVSLVFYLPIFLLGLTFAYTYVRSSGNLLVVSLLHGGYDATSFSQFLPSVGQNGGLALHYGFLALCAVVALIVILRERSAEGRELPGARGLTPSGREGPWPSWTAHDLPPARSVTSESAAAAPGIVWPTPGATVPPGSPGATTGPPPLPAGLTPVSTPPAPPSPQVAGSVGGRAAFVPPLCRRCGAIVVGDIQGFPMRCPRCGEPLPLAGEAPSLAISRVFPEPQAAPGPSPSVAPVSWPPPSVPSVRSGVGHPEEFEDLPEGAWPPLPASGRGLSHTILLASGPGPGP